MVDADATLEHVPDPQDLREFSVGIVQLGECFLKKHMNLSLLCTAFAEICFPEVVRCFLTLVLREAEDYRRALVLFLQILNERSPSVPGPTPLYIPWNKRMLWTSLQWHLDCGHSGRCIVPGYSVPLHQL